MIVSPNKIAQIALDHYDKGLPRGKGKPQANREWTVYAAIVAVDHKPNNKASNDTNTEKNERLDQDALDMWVVSCATGSKCCAVLYPNQSTSSNVICDDIKMSWGGGVLHDSHAEVLAKRGLMRLLWSEIEYELSLTHCTSKNNRIDGIADKKLLEQVKWSASSKSQGSKIQFQLRKHLTLHMYISDAPCGDAAIYDLQPEFVHKMKTSNDINGSNTTDTKTQNRNPNFTGAKLVISDHTDKSQISSTLNYECQKSDHENTKYKNIETTQTKQVLAREKTQVLSALRTKSGRSNIPVHLRSTSMSCSDKLCRWSILGLQGTMLLKWIPSPIVLSSVCVSRDLRSIFNPRVKHCTYSNKQDFVEGDSINDGQLQALQRAIPNRVNNAFKAFTQVQEKNKEFDYIQKKKIPHVYIVAETFEQGLAKTQFKKSVSCNRDTSRTSNNNSQRKGLKLSGDSYQTQQKKKQKSCNIVDLEQRFSPCGISLNWQNESICRSTIDHASYVSNSMLSINQPSKNIKKNKATKASINLELTIGASGLKQKQKQKIIKNAVKEDSELQEKEKLKLEIRKRFSRLSRYNFLQTAKKCMDLEAAILRNNEVKCDKNCDRILIPTQARYISYQNFKKLGTSEFIQETKDILLNGNLNVNDKSRTKESKECIDYNAGPLVGWIRSSDANDFNAINC